MEQQQKRWYDIDPVVSRAVAVWETAPEELQTLCAEYVIDKLKDIDFQMSLEEQYQYILRRWYEYKSFTRNGISKTCTRRIKTTISTRYN